MARKTYNQQLVDKKDMPKITELTDPRLIKRYGGPRLLIAPPIAYDEIMRLVPYGQVITADAIRAYLAIKHGADSTCPLTAGIFINIVAKASMERGADETPFWRTLKKGGELNEKFPGGLETQKRALEREGHVVVQRGRRSFVQNYSDRLFQLE